MKANKFFPLILILLVLMTAALFSCGDDDDDDNDDSASDDDDSGTDDDDDDNDDDTGPPPAILQDDNQQLLDEVTQTERSYGNDVTLLVDGVVSAPVRFDMIDSATDHINLQALDIAQDETGWETAQRIVDRLDQGVEVNVILDWLSQSIFQDGNGPIDLMIDAGANVILYFPLGWDWDVFINKRIHEKILVVDGVEAIVGGLNVGDHYYHGGASPDGWRDTDVHVTGPAVADLQARFISNWIEFSTVEDPEFELVDQDRYFPDLSQTGDTTTRYVPHTPRRDELYVAQMYKEVIGMAEDFIYIENPYFCPVRPHIDALKQAAQRGVDVRILTNSKQTNDLGEPMWYASLYYFQEFLDAGVSLYVWRGDEFSMIHSKTAAIDGVWATVGSYNFDYRSAVSNSENTFNVHGDAFGLQVAEQLEDDMSSTYADPITQQFMDDLTDEDHRKMEMYHKMEFLL